MSEGGLLTSVQKTLYRASSSILSAIFSGGGGGGEVPKQVRGGSFMQVRRNAGMPWKRA